MMDIKYIITNIGSNQVCAEYVGDTCRFLQVMDSESIAGNIYIGRVENIVKNINAAFIEIENKKKCYYSLTDNKRHIFLNHKNNQTVNVGDKLMVRILTDAQKKKPASAVSKIDLPGNYLVLSNDVCGVLLSKKLQSSQMCAERADVLTAFLQESLQSFQTEIADTELSFGFIVRSNAVHADDADVLREAQMLVRQYTDIVKSAFCGVFYTKLYQEKPVYLNQIIHLMADNRIEVITDCQEYYDMVVGNIKGAALNVRLYRDDLLPLYKLYSVEKNIAQALAQKVWLKSGGYLVIEQTEALTAIDVNSGKSVAKTKSQSNREASYLKINLEAASEMMHQLMLRNISGMIIVDFISMQMQKHQDELMAHLRTLAQQDPVMTTIVDITKLGLVEITRKKNGKSLRELWRAL